VPLSGVSYAPELEWRLAARWAGYRYEDFALLDGEEQSDTVAAYRVNGHIEALMAQEQSRRARRRLPRAEGNRKR
jgi:hypothetical protein